MPAGNYVIVDSGAIRAFVNNPAGGIARDLERRGKRVVAQARKNASGAPGPRRLTGDLQDMTEAQTVYDPDIEVWVATAARAKRGKKWPNFDYPSAIEANIPAPPFNRKNLPWLKRALEAAKDT